MPAKVAFALAAELLVFALLLYAGAGTWRWPAAWWFLVLFFGPAVLLTAVTAKRDPALIAERMRSPFQKDQPLWDKLFLGIVAVLFLTWLVAMGTDVVRFRWSHMPQWLQWFGGAAMLVGWWISYRVFATNSFLAPVVKIMAERDQTVISTGPYAVVRHPFYSGALLLMFGSSLLLGSWLGAALIALLGTGMCLRIVGEERELRNNLDGYDDYAARVRYRLIPFIW